MNEQITSAAELDALPVGSVVLEGSTGEPIPNGFLNLPVMPGVFHRFPDGWHVVAGHGVRLPEFDLGPLTVLYRPDQPQRVQPSREDVVAALKGVWFNLSDEFLGRVADAALALFSEQPTVAEVKAEALREMGKWFRIASQLGTGERDEIAAQACFDRADGIEAGR